MANDEDAWKLDDSDGEGEAAGSSSSNIAKVAAQAGLGRKASSNSLASSHQTRPSLPSSSLSFPSAAAVADSLNGNLGTAKSPPQAGLKERGRQASYGFWERLSGLGVGSSSSSSKSQGDLRSPNDTSSMSGYSRFDDQLELEDNFDGTYSVHSASGSGNQGKLMSAANISRSSLVGTSGTRGSGKVPQTTATSSSAKGKNRSLDSPGHAGATIVGTPRAKSPLGKLKRVDRPRDEEDMRKFVKKDVEDILQDPVNLLKKLSISEPAIPFTPSGASSVATSTDYYTMADSPPVPSSSTFGYDNPLPDHTIDQFAHESADVAKKQAEARREAIRREKFLDCLNKDTVDISELRKLAWAGIPNDLRPIAWQLLLGYLPSPSTRRVSVLARKRQEYADAVRLAFARGEGALDAAIWHQIQIDVPRTNPGVPLWQFASTQRSLERILYVWAIRHPASGYVQGINDLATPFFQVFLSSYIDCDAEDYDITALPSEVLSALEADTFWCLSKLLDGIQDNYIFAQPGIHRQVARCQELCSRVDQPLAKHLETEGVSFLQFSFRWFHLLFLRVLPVNSVIRMWDTYMSEGSDAFANFHTYVCLAFLLRWSEKLRSMDFQAIMLFLQDPVEHETWTESMTEMLLSEAYMWSALWSGTKNTISK